MVRKHKKSLFIVIPEATVSPSKWSVRTDFITANKRSNFQEDFQPWFKIYQSQLGKSSPPKGSPPHCHVCMSLQLDWAFKTNGQPSFLTKLPFVSRKRNTMLHGTE